MIDGNVRDFVDNLYYGTEMYFTFDGRRYFIQGWYEEGIHYLVLEYASGGGGEYIWQCSSEDSVECVQEFLDAPLWNGKKFFDAEETMTWIEPV